MVLEFNHYLKSGNVSSTIYADLESLIKKVDGCRNNPEKLLTIKVAELISSGFSTSMTSSFKNMINMINMIIKHDKYREYCVEFF